MMPRPSYAPTPHSYVPNTAFAATINLDEVSYDLLLLLLPDAQLTWHHRR
jgi:ESCRT-I complex subunit VPS28